MEKLKLVMKRFFTNRRNLILLVIVLLLAIVALLLLPGGERSARSFQGGEDTPYPYEWTEQEDGSILLSLSAQVPEGCVWQSIAQEENDLVQVKREAAEGNVFRLLPLRTGDALLRFTLADAQYTEDRCCTLMLTLEIRGEEEERSASVSGNRLILFDRALQGGEGFGCPYRLWFDEEERFSVGLSDSSQEPDWQLFRQNSGDVLQLVNRSTENGILTLRFRGSGAAGRAAR